jgi:ABC-type antimicrobial peptide transport system permease subunit
LTIILSGRSSFRQEWTDSGMNAILTRALADLRSNRLQNGLVFLIVLAATTTLCLALTIARGADDSWDRTFEESHGAHVTFFGATAEDLAGVPVGLWAWEQLFRIVAENEMGADPELFTEPSWWSLALLAPGMIALAVLASTIPARRAARVEVAEVLRYE